MISEKKTVLTGQTTNTQIKIRLIETYAPQMRQEEKTYEQ